jgi:hypothetical protein
LIRAIQGRKTLEAIVDVEFSGRVVALDNLLHEDRRLSRIAAKLNDRTGDAIDENLGEQMKHIHPLLDIRYPPAKFERR